MLLKSRIAFRNCNRREANLTTPDREWVNKRTSCVPREAEQHSKFWQNAHLYFDRVYQTMNLDPTWFQVLSSPKPRVGGVVSGADGR